MREPAVGESHVNLESVGVTGFDQQLPGPHRIELVIELVQTELLGSSVVPYPVVNGGQLALAKGQIVQQLLAIDGHDHSQSDLPRVFPLPRVQVAVARDPRPVVAGLLIARSLANGDQYVAVGVGVVGRMVRVVLLAGDHYAVQHRPRQVQEFDVGKIFFLEGVDGIQRELPSVDESCEEVG